MLAACEKGESSGRQATAGWAAFTEQLHIHHRAEDVALWPRLREAVTDRSEHAVLDAMEAEHAGIDPRLERIRAAMQDRDEAELSDGVGLLFADLREHMRHEEVEALPLVEKHLGPAGWGAFARHMRKTQGLRGAAEFFPWLLDDAPEPSVARVLGVLPPPARVLYRRLWAPRYRRRLAAFDR
jgi:iron-sulfur cluster repair protein YtfE (RIC family)